MIMYIYNACVYIYIYIYIHIYTYYTFLTIASSGVQVP